MKHKTTKPTITSLQFFQKLRWLDGTPLKIEPYRQRIFSQVLDTRRPDGTPQFNQALLGRGKKNAKSLDLILSAFYCTVVRRAVQGNEALVVAADEAQAGDDLDLAKKLIEVNKDTLGTEFDIFAKELRLKDGSGGIKIIPAGEPGGLHGKQYSFLGVDEVHTAKDWRVLEALQPDPTRRDCLVWVTSYDSVDDEEGQSLHDLKKIGMSGTDPRFYFSWYSGELCTDPAFADFDPEARANPSMSSWPEGRAYLDQQRKRLPSNLYRRLHLILPSTAAGFIDMDRWDAITDPNWREVLHDKSLQVFVGIDAGHKHDSTAIVVVYLDRETQQVRLAFHRVFVPRKGEPLDFESTIGETIRIIKQRYTVVKCLADPWQLQHLMQQLRREQIPIEEYAQSAPNLTAASENLRQLINGGNLVLYPDKAMRLSASRAVAVEIQSRGAWKISKEKASHRIDVIVALAMACYAAVNKQEPIGVVAQLIANARRQQAGPPTRHNPAGLTSPYNHSQMRNGVMGERMALQQRSGREGPTSPYWPRGT